MQFLEGLLNVCLLLHLLPQLQGGQLELVPALLLISLQQPDLLQQGRVRRLEDGEVLLQCVVVLHEAVEPLLQLAQAVRQVDVGRLEAGVVLLELLESLVDVDCVAAEHVLHPLVPLHQLVNVFNKALVQVPETQSVSNFPAENL